MWLNNNKLGKFTTGIFAPTLVGGLVFCSTSCTQNNAFVWTGMSKTFTIDYDKFPSPTIQDSEVLNSYFNNENFGNMFSQDVIHKMNYDWTIWSPSLILTYRIVGSSKGDRLSWDLKVLNEQQDILLWWTISSLKYQWVIKQDGISSVITIIPENVEIVDYSYSVKEQFWDDAHFDMVIKHRQDPNEAFTTYEFSFRTASFERDDIYKIIDFMCFQPHYYEGVAVEEL